MNNHFTSNAFISLRSLFPKEHNIQQNTTPTKLPTHKLKQYVKHQTTVNARANTFQKNKI